MKAITETLDISRSNRMNKPRKPSVDAKVGTMEDQKYLPLIRGITEAG